MEERALVVASAAIRRVGAILRGGIHAEKGAEEKAHRHDPVTVFDRYSEEVLVAAIEDSFPNHAIMSEEGARKRGDSPYTWIIDPLDGTNNFLRGIPQLSISLALVRDLQTRMACIYDPLRDELFSAIAGKGAFLNGSSLCVSGHEGIDGAVIGVGLSSRPEHALRTHATVTALIPHVRSLRTFGSACLDLSYVAAGRFDVTWYRSLSPWDVQAGVLLIVEAGGRVSSLDGGMLLDPEDGIVASNGRVHDEMISIIAEGEE